MGRIIITTNVSLDGVVQDPDGAEGSPAGGWFDAAMADDRAPWYELITDEALKADALLLGRRSASWFGSRWASRTGVLADRLNTMPKHVVSTTTTEPEWAGATVLAGDVIAAVTALKEQFDGEILVYASYQLVRTLLGHDLVDALRLFVLPVVVGQGERLFDDVLDQAALRLTDATRVGAGLVQVEYEVLSRVS